LLKIISLIFPLFLLADIKVFAPFFKETNNTIYVKSPYLIYKDFFIQADKGIIKSNKTAIFEGNVVIFYKDEILKVDRVKIISKENIRLAKSFIYDRKDNFWFLTKNAKILNNVIYFRNTIFSSCCVKNPDWYLFIKRGAYNVKSKTLRIYNIVLYLKDVPIFYFPFYVSSFNKQRRSGFLRPYIGYSVKEGFLYSQPIYFATSLRTDLEFDPTIRTQRGKGLYATFRFVDSPYSFGVIKGGEFKDFDSYFKKNNLAHQKHFGYEIEYKRDRLIGSDKLYANIKYANDVDYFYLNPYNYTFNTSYLSNKIITSKINYIKFINNNYLLGIYNRYYIDTSLLSNKSTVQTLPQINFHIFEKSHKRILTSLDYNFYNYFNAYDKYYVNTINIPISYIYSLNNYLNFKLTENIEGKYANYYNSSIYPSYILKGDTQFTFYTSFVKFSSNFLHIFSPSLTYTKNTFNNKSNRGLLNTALIDESLSLNIFEILEYNKLYITHTLHQLFLTRNSNLENQITLKFDNISLLENNKFDWKLKRTVYNSVSLQQSFNNYMFSISHTYDYTLKSKTVTLEGKKIFNKNRSFYFKYNYDLVNKYAKFMKLGVSLNKKCFQYDISISKNIFPVLKESGISYNKDYIFSLNVNFYPIGGIKQNFLFK